MISVRIFIPLLLFLVCSFQYQTEEARVLPKELHGNWQLGKLYTLKTPRAITTYNVFVSIEEDGKVSGFSGCNRFNTTLKLRNDSLLFGTLLRSRKFCEEEYLDVEDALLAGFKNTNRYLYKNNTLTLLNGNRKEIQLIRQ